MPERERERERGGGGRGCVKERPHIQTETKLMNKYKFR